MLNINVPFLKPASASAQLLVVMLLVAHHFYHLES